jgi:hypothetical protein
MRALWKAAPASVAVHRAGVGYKDREVRIMRGKLAVRGAQGDNRDDHGRRHQQTLGHNGALFDGFVVSSFTSDSTFGGITMLCTSV